MLLMLVIYEASWKAIEHLVKEVVKCKMVLFSKSSAVVMEIVSSKNRKMTLSGSILECSIISIWMEYNNNVRFF